jgi:hypothetical protein
MRSYPLAWLAMLPFGCVTTVTEVRVQDPGALALAPGAGGAPLLDPGGGDREVVADRGTYLEWLSRKPYELRAHRLGDGELRLECPACAEVGWPLAGEAAATLVGADGRVPPTLARPQLSPEALRLPVGVCFVRAPRNHCRVYASEELVIPWSNVARARQTTEPIRFAGVFLAGFGSLGLIGGSILVSPGFADGRAEGARAAVGVPMLTIGAAALGLGIWHLAKPRRERSLEPPTETEARREAARNR